MKYSGNALVFLSVMARSTTGLFTRIFSPDIPTTFFGDLLFSAVGGTEIDSASVQ